MMIDLLIFALIPEKNTFLFSGSITMTSTQNFAPERRATVKPSDTMRCRVSAFSRLNIQHTRTVRHLQKKDDFQKIMAPNFFCWIFWEAIFLVDETPHGFNGVVFLKIGWSRIPQLQPQVNIIAGKVVWKQRFMRRFGCFWGRFLGTLRDSKALGRFFFFFFWNLGIPGILEKNPRIFWIYQRWWPWVHWSVFWVSTRYIHKTKQDQASGTVPGWYSSRPKNLVKARFFWETW